MPAEESSLTTRAYRGGDETAILDLFLRSFHTPRSLDHFRWKYLACPYGNGRISLTFDNAGNLAGHYAGYPVPFRIDGRDTTGHQIGDTMTDPSVRHLGRGPTSVLGRTAGHFYETFCEGKVAFNYGFNVSNIQKFSLRFLRSDRVEPVVYRLREFSRDSLEPIGAMERWSRGYQVEAIRQVDQEWSELFRRVAGSYRFLVRRDAEYLRWRYLSRPDLSYSVAAIRKWGRLAGWIVYRLKDKRLTIGDALFDRRFDDAFEVLLRHVAAAERADSVEGWFSRSPAWFDEILSRLRFRVLPEPQDLSLMCVPFVESEATERMREVLYYTLGDSDLF